MAHVALRLRREANWRDRLFLFVIGLLRRATLQLPLGKVV